MSNYKRFSLKLNDHTIFLETNLMDKTADQWIEFEKAEQGLIDCIQNHLSVFGILPTKEHCFGIYYEVEGRNKYMYINIQYYLANNEDSVRVLYVEIEDNGFCG